MSLNEFLNEFKVRFVSIIHIISTILISLLRYKIKFDTDKENELLRIKAAMTHKEVINNLLDKKIAIFAGAGISYNSGLPIVSAFYKHFLPIFYDTDDVEYLTNLIHNGRIPFERMMEHIFNFTGNDYSIMNIFAKGEPNTLHNILAQMMFNGWANELYTTNFDCLIEKALENKGLTKKDYGYFYDERGFAKLSKAAYSKNVIKIHGTIDNEESIRATLETITSNEKLAKTC